MKKTVLTVLVSLVLGGAGGFVVGIFIYPFIFLPPPAMEKVENRAEKAVIAAGNFIHANPSDPVHYVHGSVEVLKGKAGDNLIHLKPDFKVGPVPRFHIYLADKSMIMNSADFKAAKKIDLGRLRAFEGSQVYEVPKGTDLSPVKSVVIWCKEFNVLISPATLKK
ncbi:MAG: DM13 domain-containing protein [Alphaproteobacteria bacterium]